MPIYPYKCKKSGFTIEVLRSFKEYNLPPTEDELPEAEKGKEHEWERVIGKLLFVQKTDSWGPGKGNWGK